MPGKRPVEQGDFVTARAVYRSELAVVDTDTVENASIPVLDTRGGANASVMGATSEINMYGQNAQINIYAIVQGFGSVTLDLWQKATIDAVAAPPVTPPVMTLPATEDWVKVDTKILTASGRWVVKDLSPGQYKVRFSAAAGSGKLNLLEEHAA